MRTLPDIQIRSNFYLWLLTGRSSGFQNAALNTHIDYRVLGTPDDVVEARRLLDVNNTLSDRNALAVLAASMLVPSLLRDMPENVDAVFVPGLLRLPADAVRYPFATTVAMLRSSRVFNRLMNAAGTLATFEASHANPALQVGMAGLAIIKRMLSWLDETQAGYSVRLVTGTDLREPLRRAYSVEPALVQSPAVGCADKLTEFNV